VLLTGRIEAYGVFGLLYRDLSKNLSLESSLLVSNRFCLILLLLLLCCDAGGIYLEPLVSEYFFGSWAVISRNIKHLGQEADKGISYTLIVQGKGASLDAPVEFLVCCSSVGEAAIHKSVEEDC
jgi:hypothetical protein